MKYGYARVSTVTQKRDGNSLLEQVKALKDAGCDEVITEQYTGATTKRPKLIELVSRLNEGDSLMTTKLDRLARSVAEGSKLIQDLLKRGIEVNILSVGVINDTPTGKLIADIFLSFAEFERSLICERTSSGKAIAKTKAGFREGRPPISYERKQAAVEYILSGNSYKETVKKTGLSRSTIARAVREYKASL